MKSISEIDKNFKNIEINKTDIKWYNPLEEDNMTIDGLYKAKEQKKYIRMPDEFLTSKEVNEGVQKLICHTAGGRIKFSSNSPYIAIKVELLTDELMSHMPSSGQSGFDLYISDKGSSDYRFVKTFFPSDLTSRFYEGIFELETVTPNKEEKEFLLNFPLYNGVNNVFIGLRENSTLSMPCKYDIKGTIAYYGSSITQGGCASRPGNNYMNHVSRWLNCDFNNFGFSGSAKGEIKIAQYIASLNLSAFVLDYDANAPSVEHLESTHYNFYKTIRNEHPEIPIILMSMPKGYRIYEVKSFRNNVKSDAVVMNTYLKALKENDKNVYYIDGGNIFAFVTPDACTVDNCHPNDLGFYCMAKALYPVLKRALNK